MEKATKLRLVGGAILLFNLWLIGQYNVSGIPVMLLTIGFAVAYEFFVVRLFARPSTETNENDQHLYAIAAKEIENGTLDKGLWAKCFSESDGEDNVAKAKYMKARVAAVKHRQQDALRSRKPKPETHVRCPDCRLLIPREATVCNACGCKLIPQ